MNRYGLAIVGCVLGLSPAFASAALSVSLEPNYTYNVGAIPPGEKVFDVVFHGDTIDGRPANEGLFAYDLLFRAPAGINLVRAEKPDNWVFTAPDASFSQAEADASHVLVNGINTLTGDLSDITNGKKAARLVFTIDPNIGFGTYTVTLDPTVTTFGSGDPNQDLMIPVDLAGGGTVNIIPEPSGLALFGVFAAAALRRRRPARIA